VNREDLQHRRYRDRLYLRYRARRDAARASRTLDLAWRSVILVVGCTLAGLGVFFLVFPGPGWATLWLALLTLGTEFRWARRLLTPLQSAMGAAARAARSPELRARRAAVLLTVVMAVVAASYGYLAAYGWSADGLFRARAAVRAVLSGN
jgi:uncharacterized protein (TIGR02611 family)